MATLLFLLAPFLFSINITDNLRGAESTPLAFTFKASGQEIFLDPLIGPIFSERSKRINKMNYCDELTNEFEKRRNRNTFIISGWWYNEIQTSYWQILGSPNSHFRFYEECDFLDSLKKTNAEIYYLPEQDLYNDQMFNQFCTDSLAKPFPTK